MLKWLHHEATKRHLPRDVFALTTYYLDIYIPKIPSVQPDRLQLIALGALLLATKIEGAYFPDIGG